MGRAAAPPAPALTGRQQSGARNGRPRRAAWADCCERRAGASPAGQSSSRLARSFRDRHRVRSGRRAAGGGRDFAQRSRAHSQANANSKSASRRRDKSFPRSLSFVGRELPLNDCQTIIMAPHDCRVPAAASAALEAGLLLVRRSRPSACNHYRARARAGQHHPSFTRACSGPAGRPQESPATRPVHSTRRPSTRLGSAHSGPARA